MSKKKDPKREEGAEEVFIEEQPDEEQEEAVAEETSKDEATIYQFNNLIDDNEDNFKDLEREDTPVEDEIVQIDPAAAKPSGPEVAVVSQEE
jgi:hypothetical protein